MQQNILTINAGSSSVKFALFELTDHISEKAAISGQIDGIGTDQVKLVAKDRSGTRIVDQALPAGANHAQGFDHLLRWFTSRDNAGQIVAVGGLEQDFGRTADAEPGHPGQRRVLAQPSPDGGQPVDQGAGGYVAHSAGSVGMG